MGESQSGKSHYHVGSCLHSTRKVGYGEYQDPGPSKNCPHHDKCSWKNNGVQRLDIER